MKLLVLITTLFILSTVQAKEFTHCSQLDDESNEITWYDFETAVDLAKEDKKPIFIDIYTGWCGWCKKMDNSTFKNDKVVEFMNKHYFAVKLDAETTDPIVYKEKIYEYQSYGKSGYNELAVNLLGGKMSFPSFVILSKRQVKIAQIAGYQKPRDLLAQLEKYHKK